MEYPNGSTVKLGDRVWWDEGNAIGRIIAIQETKEQSARWGVEDAGVVIGYDGAEMGGVFVSYPQHAFAEQGIQRLTESEEAEIENALRVARAFYPIGVQEATAGLFRRQRGNQSCWNVVLYHNRVTLKVIEVDPSDLCCREVPLRESGLFYDLKD